MRKLFILLWIIVIVVAIFYWIYLPVLSRYRELKHEEERLSSEIAVLDEKIKALEEERELLKNNVVHLEKVIREDFGFVRPGEIVYKFVPKKSEPKTVPVVYPEGEGPEQGAG